LNGRRIGIYAPQNREVSARSVRNPPSLGIVEPRFLQCLLKIETAHSFEFDNLSSIHRASFRMPKNGMAVAESVREEFLIRL
jgi:hypothetical protein